MNKSIIEATCELMEVAMNAKAQGHDVFVQYHAHVEQVEVRAYFGGWHSKESTEYAYDFKAMIDLEGSCAPINPAATIREAGASIIEQIEEYEGKYEN
jgi:hypothetical protein